MGISGKDYSFAGTRNSSSVWHSRLGCARAFLCYDSAQPWAAVPHIFRVNKELHHTASLSDVWWEGDGEGFVGSFAFVGEGAEEDDPVFEVVAV